MTSRICLCAWKREGQERGERRGTRICRRTNSCRDVLEDKPGWQGKNCFVHAVYCNGLQNSLTTELFLDLSADWRETIDPVGR